MRSDDFPTDEQLKCLRLASRGRLRHYPGIHQGRWAPDCVPQGPGYGRERIKLAEFVGTGTIKACQRRGWLRRCYTGLEEWRDDRRITAAGREALAATEEMLAATTAASTSPSIALPGKES